MRRMTKRPKLGTILGFTALFVALSATAWASVPRDSVGTLKIKNNSVRGMDVRDGNLRQKDLAPNARAAFREDTDTDTISEGRWFDAEDEVVEIPAATGGSTPVGSLTVGPGAHVVTAAVTVDSAEDDDNLICFLNQGDANDPLAAGNAKSEREHFSLTALATAEEVTLECRANEGGIATDVSITSVEVTPAS